MTKSQRREIIEKLISKWRPVLFLGEWEITPCFKDQSYTGDSDYDVLADISVNYPYKKALINIYPEFWTRTKEQQDTALLHEMCHCHTQELWDFCTDFANGKYHTPNDVWRSVETLTQRIAIIAKFGSCSAKV